MIVPSDPEYQSTKLIKQGKVSLPEKRAAFAAWIAERFNCPVPLNILADRTSLGDPRLQIIFEFEADAKKFYTKGGNFDPAKRLAVLDRYKEMFPPRWFNRRKHDRMFAVFCNFESVARQEANHAMSDNQIASVQRSLESTMVWAIKPLFDCVTFMLYTDDQLTMTEGSNFRQQCLEAYSYELARHDEFGYFAEKPIYTRFSSKETFERDYDGSWFYFFR
jgi:hypothetical protein